MKNLTSIATVLAIVALCGCPRSDTTSQRPSSEAKTSTEPSPTPTSSNSQPDENISATLEQNSIAAIQTSTARVVMDFNYRLTGPLTLRGLEAAITTNDAQAQGSVTVELNGVVVWTKRIEHITRMIEGRASEIQINTVELAPSLLTAGTHRFRIIIDSDHGVGDALQGEIRRIVTDKTDHNVVFRWASILCG